MENSNFDWVTPRLNCNADGVFKMIRDQVVQDVGVFNKLQRYSDARKIELEGAQSNHNFRMTRMGFDFSREKMVEVNIENNKVIVNKIFAQEQFEISMAWSRDKGRCNLMVNDRPMELWQVSQKIIGYMLFPGE